MYGIDQLSYAEWLKKIELIATDPYWNSVTPTSRCGHLQQSVDHVLHSPKYAMAAGCIKSEVSEARSLNSQAPGKKGKKNVKVEEIVLSTSSCDSEVDSDCSDSEESDDSLPRRKKGKRGKSRSRRKSRSVVTPPPFELDGKVHLKDYLTTFEQYFENEFVGNSYDQTQALAKYLTGDLLKVYEARGGRKLKYQKMKEELLSYYRKLKIGGKTFWRRKLESVNPEKDENWEIFSMRLIEMGQLAYPKDPKECASQIRKVFLKALHPSVMTKIVDAERAQKAASGGKKKHFSLNAIAQMAKDLQENSSTPKSIMWVSDVGRTNTVESTTQNTNEDNGRCFQCAQRQTSTGANQATRHQPVRQYGGTEKGKCSYCYSRNHFKRECWKLNNKCLICGGDHFMQQCPKYDPNWKKRSSSHGKAEKPLNDQVSLLGGRQ